MAQLQVQNNKNHQHPSHENQRARWASNRYITQGVAVFQSELPMPSRGSNQKNNDWFCRRARAHGVHSRPDYC